MDILKLSWAFRNLCEATEVTANIQLELAAINLTMNRLPAACGTRAAKINGYVKWQQAAVFSHSWSRHEQEPWPVGSQAMCCRLTECKEDSAWERHELLTVKDSGRSCRGLFSFIIQVFALKTKEAYDCGRAADLWAQIRTQTLPWREIRYIYFSSCSSWPTGT
jgi:hypothetical protein